MEGPCRNAPYSRKGDNGQTSLADGRRVEKDDARIEACGTIDELNCHIGWLAAAVPEEEQGALQEMQRRLFAIGALAAGVRKPDFLPGREETEQLERRIDGLAGNGEAAFQGFILPGGCEAAARAHLCRAVCRRAERRFLAAGKLAEEAEAARHAEALAYLNRLSSYFYVLAKKLNIFLAKREINL